MTHSTAPLVAVGSTQDAEPALEDRIEAGSLKAGVSEGLKRSFDIGAVAVALLLFLPLIVTLIALLMLAQGRPVIYRHSRMGRGGKPFHCFKFRTMAIDGDDLLRRHLAADPVARMEWEATRKLKDDPRITPLGRVLRKTSADELPQLLNVLRGEMSLVGPRPIVHAEAAFYGPYIDHYHRVKPGLTGAWQISGRSDTSYAERVQLDAQYAVTRSFGGDLKILMRTVPAVLRARGSY